MADQDCRVQQTDPAPFHLIGNGNLGVLLLHGFGGTPREMIRIGRYLHDRGVTVHAPLLPGHGTTLAAMNTVRWQDWATATQNAYHNLAQSCDKIFAAGFSMGSLLALWLSITESGTAGTILYSPALKVADWRIILTPVLRVFIKSIAHKGHSDLKDPTAENLLGGFGRYPVSAAAELNEMRRYVWSHIKKVRAPACVIYSVLDRSIHPQSGVITVQKLSRIVPVDAMVLYDCGHAVVVDQEWESVAEETFCFIHNQ